MKISVYKTIVTTIIGTVVAALVEFAWRRRKARQSSTEPK